MTIIFVAIKTVSHGVIRVIGVIGVIGGNGDGQGELQFLLGMRAVIALPWRARGP